MCTTANTQDALQIHHEVYPNKKQPEKRRSSNHSREVFVLLFYTLRVLLVYALLEMLSCVRQSSGSNFSESYYFRPIDYTAEFSLFAVFSVFGEPECAALFSLEPVR